MELYCEIGKTVCQRTEKGAAVMASEYLNKQYPDAKGFSPRSLRRMRDFYRTYENHPALLSRAMQLGWIQNVVIMEADLTMELREWYMKAVKQFGWSKTELIANIAENGHENIVCAIEDEVCQTEGKEKKQPDLIIDQAVFINAIQPYLWRFRKWWLIWKGHGRRWRFVCKFQLKLPIWLRLQKHIPLYDSSYIIGLQGEQHKYIPRVLLFRFSCVFIWTQV